MKLETLHDLFVDELRDLFSAESQLVKAISKMAKAASSAELKTAIEEHLMETKEQVVRLERIFEDLELTPKGKKCKAMEGLIEEGSEVIDEDGTPAVKDAALIAAAQRVEHYEIAGYGCVRTYARLLGHEEAESLLQETLDEEAQADKHLTELAESVINVDAEASDGEDEETAAFTMRKSKRNGVAHNKKKRVKVS